MTPTPEQLAFAQKIACRVVLDYGEGDEREYDAALNGKLRNDHPAVHAALAAIIETTEAAAKLADDRHAAWVATRLRANEHLKGRT